MASLTDGPGHSYRPVLLKTLSQWPLGPFAQCLARSGLVQELELLLKCFPAELFPMLLVLLNTLPSSLFVEHYRHLLPVPTSYSDCADQPLPPPVIKNILRK